MPAVRLITSAQITVATAGTEQRVVATNVQNVVKLYVSVPTGNTGVAFLGDASVSSTVGQIIEKGVTREISAPSGEYLDIYNMYVDVATSGDKVNVSYLQLV